MRTAVQGIDRRRVEHASTVVAALAACLAALGGCSESAAPAGRVSDSQCPVGGSALSVAAQRRRR
jgi:hypothetical protein